METLKSSSHTHIHTQVMCLNLPSSYLLPKAPSLRPVFPLLKRESAKVLEKSGKTLLDANQDLLQRAKEAPPCF